MSENHCPSIPLHYQADSLQDPPFSERQKPALIDHELPPTGPSIQHASNDQANRQQPAPRKRRLSGNNLVKHRRTRNGCYTCRGRRVKCDEQHPICQRCKKGSRECTYPEPRPNPKPPESPRQERQENSQQESRGSAESTDEEDDGEVHGEEVESQQRRIASVPWESQGTKLASGESPPSRDALQFLHQSDVPASEKFESTPSPSRRFSGPPHSAASDSQLKFSPASTVALPPNGRSWPNLAQDLQFYLHYHQTHVTFHHYFFKHDASHFFRTLLIEQAIMYEPLLYAVTGFAAFHLTVKRIDGKMQDFLGYYNKSVSSLRESLASREPHTDATVLTVLQLATFEEYLGDWVSLLSHQQAAYRMLLELYNPVSIVQNELGRRILAWYLRFDLTGGIMSGNETALGREWFAALGAHYHRQIRHDPSNIDHKIEAAVADHWVVCTDMALLFAKLPRGDISIAEFRDECQKFLEYIRTWHDNLDPVFRDDQYRTMSFGGLAKDPEDIVDPYKPGGLYHGPLTTFNFMTLDWLAVSAVFQNRMALVLEQPPSPELPLLALELCRIFEAIEYSSEIPEEAILKAQGSLGVASIFLPKDERHTMWCRRKLAKIEGLGHIYPPTYRQRMAALWNVPEINHWWLPNEEAYPSVVRSVRSFMEDRLYVDTKKRSQDQRELKGIFSEMTVKEEEETKPMELTPLSGEQPGDESLTCPTVPSVPSEMDIKPDGQPDPAEKGHIQ